jgi:hypothetical protein
MSQHVFMNIIEVYIDGVEFIFIPGTNATGFLIYTFVGLLELLLVMIDLDIQYFDLLPHIQYLLNPLKEGIHFVTHRFSQINWAFRREKIPKTPAFNAIFDLGVKLFQVSFRLVADNGMLGFDVQPEDIRRFLSPDDTARA